MELLVKNIVLPFDEPSEYAIEQAVSAVEAILHRRPAGGGHIYKKSVDARRRDAIKFVYTASVTGDFTPAELEVLAAAGIVPLDVGEPEPVAPGDERLSARPVVIGFGPCGMFCALALAGRGYRPLVLERGSDVDARVQAVERFSAGGEFDPACNVQFGAGGAGTFSDGKLVTRINDRLCRYVLRRLHEFGAPEEILVAAKPHIGTDRLRAVVAALRDEIIRLGGEIVFDCRADRFIFSPDGAVRAVVCMRTRPGAETAETLTFDCGALVLATGHSARDVYKYLAGENFTLATKPFSVGVRIEHLRADVDAALYGAHAGDPRLGAAEYAYSKRWDDGSAVYTFCMCPGGEVIAAASEPGGMVVNGMSHSAREGVNSNAALVASIDPAPGRPLDAVEFQRKLERATYDAAADAGEFFAPCQTAGDFLDGRVTTKFGRVKPTYRGGRVALRDLSAILPREICERIRAGILDFGRRSRFFGTRDALLTGVETRTSAPLRIMRGEDFVAPGRHNVYPCGEGAGYAGGITSAAVDGLRVAEALVRRYAPPA